MKNDDKHFDYIDVEEEFEQLMPEEVEKMIEDDWADYQKNSTNPMGATSKIVEEYEEWFKNNDTRKKSVYRKLITLNRHSEAFQNEEIKMQFIEVLRRSIGDIS